jgi:hypothetical protein
MTITALLTMLALAVGSGTTTTQPTESDSLLCPAGMVCTIASHCWVNGTWTTPCPDDAPPPPDGPKDPETLLPY